MVHANTNFSNIKESYLFSEIGKRVATFSAANPDKKIIKLGIGDVTLPIPDVCVKAAKDAASEMGNASTFRGYGPEQGYDFIINAVKIYYASFGVELDENEIFISDGAKSDIGNITDLFSNNNTVVVPDPVYPVYVDSNLMLGRNVVYIDATEKNGFLPSPDAIPSDVSADIIYLCSPNNPTGASYSKAQLADWVDYACKNGLLVLYDAAYEAFVEDESARSIFSVPGAKKCAIEFCSFSKTAGFTGMRCGYTIISNELIIDGMSINKMWLRRQTTKFNGVPYIIQRAAAAALSPEGITQCRQNIAYYKNNASKLAEFLESKNIAYTGGKNSPYVWFKVKKGMTSWEFFDYLLENVGVVGTPGSGFGKNGEGWFRLTGFGNAENTLEAIERLKTVL